MNEAPKLNLLTLNKHQQKLLNKIEKERIKEMERQLELIYYSACLALSRHHGWKYNRLFKMVMISRDVLDECHERTNTSIIEMCWEEIGIDLMREDSEVDWSQIFYLSSEKDMTRAMTPFEFIQMKQNQIKWIPAQITSCILIALHRKEGWGAERCGRLFMEIEEIKQDYHLDAKALHDACKEETGFEWVTLEDDAREFK